MCVWKKEKKVALLYLIFIVSRYIGLAEKKPIQRFTCNVEARPAISMISVSMAAVPVVSKWRSLSKVLRFLRKFGCVFDDKRLFIRSFGEFCYYPIRNERNLLLWISKNFIRRKDWTIAVSTKRKIEKNRYLTRRSSGFIIRKKVLEHSLINEITPPNDSSPRWGTILFLTQSYR